MSLYIILLAVFVGLARGRTLAGLLAYPWQRTGWLYASLGIQLFLGTSYAETLPSLRGPAALLNMGSMAILLWALVPYLELWGGRLAFAGVLMNLAVIFANGGKMPVSPAALAATGMPATRIAFLAAGRSLTHRLMRPGTGLWFLGDVIYMPRPVARSPVFSAGDIALWIGLFLLIQHAMAPRIEASIQVDTPGTGC